MKFPVDAATCLALTWAAILCCCCCGLGGAAPAETDSRVNVHIFIMSGCTTSRAFERLFLPLYARMFPIIDFQADYIGRIDPSHPPLDLWTDIGWNDVRGDIYEVCTIEATLAAPRNASKGPMQTALEFILCVGQNVSALADQAAVCVGEMFGPPSRSALARNISSCAVPAVGAQGPALVRDSFLRSESFQASWAPVIWINNQFWCIWGIKSCPFSTAEDIEKAICAAYKGPLASKYCF